MDIVRVRVLRNRLPKIRDEAIERVDHELEVSAHTIEQDVKGLGPHAAPYRTGNLRRSYHVLRRKGLQWLVQNDVELAPYAVYVEYGTRRMAARPHLTPAAEAERPGLLERLREVLGRWR